jgi:hypothetical protein
MGIRVILNLWEIKRDLDRANELARDNRSFLPNWSI